MNFNFVTRYALIAGACGWLSVNSAEAGFVLVLDDKATAGIDVIVADNANAGTTTTKGPTTHNDLVSNSGVVVYTGSVGSFMVNVTTGVSKPVIGTSGMAMLDLNNISVSGGAGTLEILLTDTDFLLSSQPGPHQFYTEIGGVLAQAIGGASAARLTYEAVMNKGVDGNNEFGDGNGDGIPDGTILVSAPPGQPFGPGGDFSSTSDSLHTSLGGSEPFSLTQKITLTHYTAGQSSSFNANATVIVPEPSTLAIWGTFAGALVFMQRRRRAARATV